MNIVFFGSDDFAATHLKSLITSSFEVVGVVCPPDRAKGRGMQVVESPVKTLANEHDIDLMQPKDVRIKGCAEQLKSFNADLFVVVAYGQFLSQDILNIPKIFAINVHASLLPKYRGAAPINWAIVNGEKVSGISIFKLVKQMDAGDILLSEALSIQAQETSVELRTRMMELGPKVLSKCIELIQKEEYTLSVQDTKEVSFAPKLSKEDGLIDWSVNSIDIHNKVRGLLPWPSAYTKYKDKNLKILEAEVAHDDCEGQEPGTILNLSKKGIVVVTKQGSLLVKKVHYENSKPMDAHSFVNGHGVEVGNKFN